LPPITPIIDQLRRAHIGLEAAAQSLLASLWREPPRDGAWSAVEVVAHLIMVEERVTGGARKLLQESPPRVSIWRRWHVPPRFAEWRVIRARTPIPLDPDFLGEKDAMLERLAGATQTTATEEEPQESEALRLVEMSLELGVMGETVRGAVDDLLEQGKAVDLLALLDGPEAPPDMVDAIWQHLATPEVIRRMLMNEPRDTEVVERLVARMGLGAAEPMLDALEIADSRTARRRLLTRLGKIGTDIGSMVVDRLPGSPWFVQRNLLALLGSLPAWPRNFSPAPYATNRDPRVRREALKLMLRLPSLRDEAIAATLADEDEQIVRLGFSAATESCPPSALPRLMTLLNDRSRDSDLRALGIRVLMNVRTPATRQWLVEQSLTRKKLFRGRRLVGKTPELLATLAVLGKNWRADQAAAEVLRLAQLSNDPEVRGAAQPPRNAS